MEQSVSNQSPFISIVIPTWNRPTFLNRLVECININNCSDDLEIVIVDNASQQSNWNKLLEIAAQHRNIRLCRNSENIGMTPNWNKAISCAAGQWIGFICDDDTYNESAFYRVRELISKVSAPCLIIQQTGISAETDWMEPGVTAAKSLSLPPASGQFWHRSLTDTLGGFDERIKYCPDPEFWTRLACNFHVLKVRDLFVVPNQHDTNYMWEAFRSPDFIEQVELSIRLCCKQILGEKFLDEKLVQGYVDDGIWETLRTVLNNTFLRKGKMKGFHRYLFAFVVLSVKINRKSTMAKTVARLPINRAKEIIKGVFHLLRRRASYENY